MVFRFASTMMLNTDKLQQKMAKLPESDWQI